MSHGQTLLKNDTEQDNTCHRTTSNQVTGRIQIREIILNLTQHIEDGYEEGMITGTAFVDLSAAYDTVNHRLLIQKLYNTTLDSQLCRVIQNLLSDRRFYVQLNNERSRWRIQKNGLPQGSVLSPTLFNIYTNDQPILDGTRSFINTDNLCTTAQYPTFQRSRPTRGGTVSQQTTPENRNHYYPDSLLFVSAGFLPRVSLQRLN